jgi:alkylresorcinol/alkylpyrone synthase
MSQPTLLSLATGLPNHRHSQTKLHDRWLSPYLNSQRSRALFEAAEIDSRYSVLPTSDFLADEPGTQARNSVYLEAARPLAAQTILRTLAGAGITAQDINHFIVISCTGFDTPGLDVMLAADLGMRPDLRRTALIGMGCHAGLTGLDRALLELAARPQNHALILAVEFGTLHFQHGGKLDNLIASAIFGDGLAAAVVGPESPGRYGPRLIDTMTYSDYCFQELMGFHLSDKGFQIHLSTQVSKVLRNAVPNLVTDFLNRAHLSQGDITFWGIHPGGAKIIDYIGQALNLKPEDIRFTRQVLRQYGNISSAAIYFVLDEIIQNGRPQPEDYGLLLSFGPGLTIELVLIQW